MAYIKAIQIFAEFTSEPDARGAFAFLMSQDDCFAGRVYHNEVDCKWIVEAHYKHLRGVAALINTPAAVA